MTVVVERGFESPEQPADNPVNTPHVALRCRGLVKRFSDIPIVQGVTFSVNAGDILVLVGPSGCGKTTTLRLVAGFERLDAGTIEIGSETVAAEDRHLAPERRRVGMVFQDYAVFPHMSVGRNVGFALGKGAAARERVADLLDFVGLPGQENKMPHELSGGEQQRVSLARALSIEPAVLLLDEPFSNLDAALRAAMRAEVRAMLKRLNTTAVFVTHDQEEALALGDQIGVMREGRLEQIGIPETIFHRPQTRFVAEFLGNTCFITGRVTAAGIETPLGVLARSASLGLGATVEIAVRPDDVAIAPDDAGAGRVISRAFTGMTYIYRIGLPDGTVVQSMQPHESPIAEGTSVAVAISPGSTPPVFIEGVGV